MKMKILILTAACVSCFTSDVFAVPLGNPVAIGAAVGAFNGALGGANAASAGVAVFKGLGSILRFISSKALSALAANSALIKGVAIKSAVQGATLGTGIAIGAAVASHKHHIFEQKNPSENEIPIEHHEAPMLLESYPSYHHDHQQENAPVFDTPLYHHQPHQIPYEEFSGYHGSAPSTHHHSQQYAEGVYR